MENKILNYVKNILFNFYSDLLSIQIFSNVLKILLNMTIFVNIKHISYDKKNIGHSCFSILFNIFFS